MKKLPIQLRLLQWLLWILLLLLMALVLPEGPPAQTLDLTAEVSQAGVVAPWNK